VLVLVGAAIPSAAYSAKTRDSGSDLAKQRRAYVNSLIHWHGNQTAVPSGGRNTVHATKAAGPGIEEAWPGAFTLQYCNGVEDGNESAFGDYVRAGITSGTVEGSSVVAWLAPGHANNLHLEDNYSVSGVATYWNSPGDDWWVIGDSLSWSHDLGDFWHYEHQYNLKYTGFIAYYTHTTIGTVYFANDACTASASADAWF
jgi:hypothetical protein